jgi:hypothetical protein
MHQIVPSTLRVLMVRLGQSWEMIGLSRLFWLKIQPVCPMSASQLDCATISTFIHDRGLKNATSFSNNILSEPSQDRPKTRSGTSGRPYVSHLVIEGELLTSIHVRSLTKPRWLQPRNRQLRAGSRRNGLCSSTGSATTARLCDRCRALRNASYERQ